MDGWKRMDGWKEGSKGKGARKTGVKEGRTEGKEVDEGRKEVNKGRTGS